MEEIKKRKIAIISLGYLWFPCESGTSRFFDIANTFVNEGFEVECITTSFQHFKKEPRNIELIKSQNYPFEVTFIESPSYKKNIDFRRVVSNNIAAKNLKKYLYSHINQYDVVYVSIPANNIAAMVTKLCKKKDVPVVVDIEDLWPEAMSMIVKNKILQRLLFWKFDIDAEITYKNADGIIGTSEDYTNRAFKKREKNIPNETVYVGCNLKEFDEGVSRYSSEVEKRTGDFWVTYAGSISTSYDIKTLIDAGYSLREKNIHIQILGTGSLKDELEEYSKNMENIHFWGFVPYPKMAAVLSKSDVVVNSFVKGAPQSIVNKIGDYLASGKPMINTLENPYFCKIVEEYNIGINVEPEQTEKLKDAIGKIACDKTICYKMGENARTISEKKFNRLIMYQRIIDMTKKIVLK